MNAVLITLNICAGLFLIGVVLLQSGKGADMGAAFGGASSTVFGPSGAGNVLTKVTAATAATFMITSLLLAVISAQQESVFDGVSEPGSNAAPLGGVDPIAPGSADVGTDAAALNENLNEAAEASTAAVDGLIDSAGEAAETVGEATGTEDVPPPSPLGE